jgi:hypothetical protein
LKKTQVLLKKPGRQVKCRFFHRFFRQNRLFKTGFFTGNVNFWGSYISETGTVKYATRFKAA